MRESVQILTQHLENLGFLINREKSVLEPKKIQEFLGFQFNTQTMSISLPTHKVTKLLQRIRQAEVPVIRSCRWIASLLGKMTAVIPAIGEALLHIRHMQRDLSRSLRTHNHNWDKNCKLSAQSMEEITWWKKYLVKKNGLPIHKLLIQEPSAKIYVDASDVGWGVTSQLIQTAGFWTPAEKEQSINVRELKTIYYALLIHSKRLKHTTIKILSDNMTALKYVTKAGGTASFALQDLAVKIQDLCNLHHLTVQYQHIPGILNVTADQLSRSKKPLYESTIPKKMFHSQPPTTELLEFPRGSICDQDRRLPPRLEEERTLHVSTMETDSEGSAENESGQDERGYLGDSIMEESILVPHNFTNETSGSTHSMECEQPMEVNRLEVISHKRKNNGLNQDTIEHLSKTTCSSTSKAYNSYWRKYAVWCRTRNYDPKIYNIQQIVTFLVDNRDKSYSTLNGYRSAVASVLTVLHPNSKPIAESRDIVDFFKAKRRGDVQIKKITQLETWDVDTLIQYIRDTDILRNQVSGETEGVLLQIREPKESQQKHIKLGFLEGEEQEEVCVVKTLLLFIQKTQDIREGLPIDHTLLLTSLNQSDPTKISSIRQSTVASWLSTHMQAAGIDPTYKPHSIRSASSTKAVVKGMSKKKY
ncbi:hypothetical protein G6F60_012229 [Rhizopus arrhizus]|nr:hypothetical protein G6F60_012229 [Rhizopus arrhizus]